MSRTRIIRTLALSTALMAGPVGLAQASGSPQDSRTETQEQVAFPCQFGQALNAGYSSADSEFGTVTANGSWRNGTCDTDTATVTTQLQKKVDGSWVDVGSRGVKRGAHSGGGEDDQATSSYDCESDTPSTFRAWVEAVPDGVSASRNRLYLSQFTVNCS